MTMKGYLKPYKTNPAGDAWIIEHDGSVYTATSVADYVNTDVLEILQDRPGLHNNAVYDEVKDIFYAWRGERLIRFTKDG